MVFKENDKTLADEGGLVFVLFRKKEKEKKKRTGGERRDV